MKTSIFLITTVLLFAMVGCKEKESMRDMKESRWAMVLFNKMKNENEKLKEEVKTLTSDLVVMTEKVEGIEEKTEGIGYIRTDWFSAHPSITDIKSKLKRPKQADQPLLLEAKFTYFKPCPQGVRMRLVSLDELGKTKEEIFNQRFRTNHVGSKCEIIDFPVDIPWNPTEWYQLVVSM